MIWVCAAFVATGCVLAIVRAERGPSMLDRTVALDIVLTTLIAAVALYAAVRRRADVVPVLVALSLVGFVGSVTIARFAAVEPADEGRIDGLDASAESQPDARADVGAKADQATEADPAAESDPEEGL